MDSSGWAIRISSGMLSYLVLAAAVQGVLGLKLITLDMPAHSVTGDSVLLNCMYELDGDDLYSIKWYKGTDEFYRYLPKDKPPAQNFDLPGVEVDMVKSNDRVVLLRNVGLNTSGVYRCEVSAEAPSFQTVVSIKEMVVIDLPDEKPTITGGRAKYKVDDKVKVNCTSLRSKPAATLTWYINDERAKKQYLLDFPPIIDRDGLETSILGLEFKVEEHHFQNGGMKLSCSATIAPIYHNSTDFSIMGEPMKAAVLESKGIPVQVRPGNQSPTTVASSWLLSLVIVLCLMLRR